MDELLKSRFHDLEGAECRRFGTLDFKRLEARSVDGVKPIESSLESIEGAGAENRTRLFLTTTMGVSGGVSIAPARAMAVSAF